MDLTSDPVEWRDIFDPFSPGLISEPHHAYRRLREVEPVHWSPPLNAWILTRFDDVRAVLEDSDFEVIKASTLLRELSHRSGRTLSSTIRFVDNILFFTSGETHRQARRTAVRVMNRMPLSQLEPFISDMADRLIDRLPANGRFDVVAAFADPFPQMVMAHILGIPEVDVSRLSASLAEVTRVFDTTDLKSLEAIERGVSDATALVSVRMASAPEDSGLGMILESTSFVEDAVGLALFLYRVGSETTIGMLALSFKTLMDRPDIATRLSSDPSLIPIFVSEILRLQSNVQRSIRVGRVDKQIGGHNVRAGERVMLLIGAANRDPVGFEDPDMLSFERRPPDLAFGAGAHACLGITLARLEGRVAVERFLRWLPAVRTGEEKWYVGRTIRRLTRLSVKARAVSDQVGS